MEMCDIMAITKAEGDNERPAERAKAEYQNALHLFPERADSWFPPVITVSALQHKGMDTLMDALTRYEAWSKERGWTQKRKDQLLYQMEQEWVRQLKQSKMQDPNFVLKFKSLQELVSRNEISLSSAVQQLVRD
jgi:LAO/AO transport system kinase